MAVYTNDLRLKEIATGDESGTWGTSTNTNLSLVAEAFSFGTEAITTNADTHTTTIADGATDPGRSIFLKYTGTLDSACTITIGPNTVSKLWLIENATSGGFSIIIKQGSGATVTIANGQTKAIYSDGAGSGGAMVDAFQDLSIPDLFIDDDLTFTSDSAVITFGADGDTTLTHTDGSGLTLNGTNKLMFNDASQFIQGSSATVLSLGATDEIDLTATAIDINGTVDMSSTLAAGAATFSVTDTSDALTVTSTDAGAGVSPIMVLYRNSSSAADSDQLGRIKFRGRNDSPHDVEYAEFLAQILDATDGEEDGRAAINVMTAGTSQSRIDMRATETSINNESIDLDFRVESNNNASMLLVDAGNDAVVVGHTASIASAGEAHELQVYDTNFSLISATTFRNGSDGAALSLGHSRSGTIGTQTVLQDGDIMGAINFLGSDGTDLANFGAAIRGHVDGTPGANDMPGRLSFLTTADGSNSPTERMRINQKGSVGIGVADGDVTSDGTAARTYVGIIGTANRGRLNLGTTASNGADAGTLVFTNGANPLADFTVDTTSGVQDTGTLFINGTRSIKIQAAASDEVVLNEGSLDVDFRAESNGNANMLFVDAGNDRVGIGTNAPSSPLTVTMDAGGIATFTGISAGGVSSVLMKQSRGSIASPSNSATAGDGNYLLGQVYNSGYATIGSIGIITGSAVNNGVIQFNTANGGTVAERMRVSNADVIINENGDDQGFRIESNNNANLFNVDAGNDHINIGQNVDYGGTVNIANGDNTAQLVLVSTDTDANGGPVMSLYRASASSAADNDELGLINFQGLDDANNATTYASIATVATDVSNGSEDGQLQLNAMRAGTLRNFLHLTGSVGTVFNEDSNDIDFRVESDGNSNMLFVEASTNRVAIGTGTTDTGTMLTVGGAATFTGQNTAHGASRLKIGQDTTAISQIRFYGADTSTAGILQFTGSSSDGSVGAERMRIGSDGSLTLGNSTYGSSLGQLRVINDANATAPASLSLFGFGNVADGGEFAKIEFCMQISGTGGDVVAKIEGEAEGTNENAADLVFQTATGGSLNERMRISSVGVITKRLAASGTGMPGTSVTLADTNSVNGLSGSSNAGGLMLLSRDSGNLRSISAAGTINASGADYAEYMTKADGCGAIAKGDVVGVDVNGKLTDVFADAISFVIKSTDPSYVGGDNWMTPEQSDPDSSEYINPLSDEYNALRASQDRIAFSGQVPVNITGSFNVGDYVYPEADGSGIKAVAKSSPTFEEYQLCVGKIWATEEDGRPFVAVKIG